MNRTEFRDLLAYLKNRPSEAALLRDVLFEKSECKQANEPLWMTAREVGYEIKKSSRWVREHIHLLPQSSYERRGNKNTWYIDFNSAKLQLQQLR